MSETDPRGGPLAALLARLGLGPRLAAKPAVAGAGAEIVDHARDFPTVTVAEVMTPRADITAVELSASLDEVAELFVESEHSRLPVYRESLDDPVGVVHIRDLFRLMVRPDGKDGAGALGRLKRESLYVPPSMRAAELLLRMQASRTHMAMVIDEFGGLDGLVTLEDLIEPVVGDIDDEHDPAATAQIVARPGGLFDVDARAPLEELELALGRELRTEDMSDEPIETAAGLVTALAGRVPQRGEIIAHASGLEIEVTDADPRRVKRLRVRLAPTAVPPAHG
jgi:CBS domain containing-hemolysin-like protein